MDQLDYGDYHKFKVSLGVACIIAAFLVPWVFLRESFDLLVEPGQLAKLNESTRALIEYRQYIVQELIRLVPYLSAALLIIGMVLVIRGLQQWKSVQQWSDEEQRLKVQKLEKEIKQMTPVEIQEKAETEVAESESPEVADGSDDSLKEANKPSVPQSFVGHYLAIEHQLSLRIEQCLKSEYKVLQKRRLGAAEYDLILAAHSQTVLDVVVEIKYAAKNFGRHWVIDNVLKMIIATELYAKATNRKAVPAILFVSPEELLKRKNTDHYRVLAAREAIRLGSELEIAFIAEEDLNNLNCQKVREILSSSIELKK
jgi:hypothetical protein